MKKSILIISLFLFSFSSFAVCTIRCNVRYYPVATHESYFSSKTTGRMPVYSGYGDDWSDTYTVDVSFYSGYELGDERFDDNAIIAVIRWNNGGYSTIKIKGWTTKLKYMTREEALYDSHGNPIKSENGYDTKNILWYIEFY